MDWLGTVYVGRGRLGDGCAGRGWGACLWHLTLDFTWICFDLTRSGGGAVVLGSIVGARLGAWLVHRVCAANGAIWSQGQVHASCVLAVLVAVVLL